MTAKKPGQPLRKQNLSWLFNCLLLHRYFDDDFFDWCGSVDRHSWAVGILRREDSEMSGMHHEMISFRFEEVDVILRAVFRFHDAVKRVPAHLFAACNNVLDISLGVVRFPMAFFRQLRFVFLHQREHRITVDFVTSDR